MEAQRELQFDLKAILKTIPKCEAPITFKCGEPCFSTNKAAGSEWYISDASGISGVKLAAPIAYYRVICLLV